MSNITDYSNILDIRKRHLILAGDVDTDMLLKTLLAFRALESKSKTRGITVLLSTPGGDLYDCYAIYDRIKASPCPVTIIGTGYVMSSGTVILQAAKHRLLTQNARFMIHYGTIEITDSRTKDAAEMMKLSQNVDNPLLEDIYLSGIKRRDKRFTRTQLKKLLEKDSFMTAQAAVDLGLADKVIK